MAEVQPVLLPRNVLPSKYILHLEPDLKTFNLDGDLSVEVTVNEPTSEISLHSRDIDFKSVKFVASSGDTFEATNISSNLGTNQLPWVTTFSFSKSDGDAVIPAGSGVLKILFRGELNDQMAGFYRSSYTSVEGEKRIMASTQFEALDARRCFPCWDEPDVKASFECSLTVADHLTAFSNMPETEVTQLTGNKKRISFAESPKMSTYLLAFCVGEFDFVQAYTKGRVAVRVYTPPGKKHLGTFSLDAAVRSLDFYDDFFGVPYPLPKLDMVAIPEFAMGAMENWGLVTYREVDILIDTEKASSQQKQRVCTVVTHELAHQWFGNLVTMKWWDNLWLNEGFASWMQNFAADFLYPEWKMWDQFTTNAMSIARSKDALRSSHPIQVPIAHAEEVEEVFDAISYYKGACVVRMVYAVVGQEHFREGLRLYFQKYGYGNTVTTQLWDAWSQASGKDIGALMGMWTGRMGFPVINVTSVDAATGDVELSQEWFLSDGSPLSEEEQAFLWNVPLMVAAGDGIASEPKLVMMKEKTLKLPGIAANGAAVLLNAGQQSLFRVNYGPELTGRLAKVLPTLSAIDRASLISDNLALAEAGRTPLEQVLTLLASLKGEESFVVWSVVRDTLSFLKPKIMELGEDIFAKFREFAGHLARACFADRGWDSKPDDGHLDTLLRAIAISLQLTYNDGDESLLAEVRRRVSAYAADPKGCKVLAGDLIVPAFRFLLKNGGAAEYAQIQAVYDAVDTNVEKKNVLLSLGATSSPELKRRTMDWSLAEVKVQDFFYPFHGVAFSGPVGRDIAWNFFQTNFDALFDKLRNASPSLMNAVIIYCCSAFSTKDKANELAAYLLEEKKTELKANKRCIDQMLESMRANAEFIEKCKTSSVASAATWDAFISRLSA